MGTLKHMTSHLLPNAINLVLMSSVIKEHTKYHFHKNNSKILLRMR